MLYQGGVSTGVVKGMTLDTYGNGGNSVGVFKGVSTSTTALAQRFAPPKVNHLSDAQAYAAIWGGSALGFLLVAWVSQVPGFTILAVLIAIFCGIMSARFVAYFRPASTKDAQARAQLARWERSLACLTCGNTFQM